MKAIQDKLDAKITAHNQTIEALNKQTEALCEATQKKRQ